MRRDIPCRCLRREFVDLAQLKKVRYPEPSGTTLRAQGHVGYGLFRVPQPPKGVSSLAEMADLLAYILSEGTRGLVAAGDHIGAAGWAIKCAAYISHMMAMGISRELNVVLAVDEFIRRTAAQNGSYFVDYDRMEVERIVLAMPRPVQRYQAGRASYSWSRQGAGYGPTFTRRGRGARGSGVSRHGPATSGAGRRQSTGICYQFRDSGG